jgi:hypothetical protein
MKRGFLRYEDNLFFYGLRRNHKSSFWVIHLFIYKEIGRSDGDKKSDGAPAQVV